MANVLQIPVPAQNAALVWPARSDPTVSTILLINQDLNNTVYIGQQSSITANGQNTIPVPPNGSISVDPASPWYVVGAAAGIRPLVMVPNGQANFRGVTQALGELAIPSIRSPNYDPVSGVGWSINQDGTASFNQVTIVIQATGVALLIYFPTPGQGNLIGSWAASATTDQYGNTVPQGINVNGGVLNAVTMNGGSIIASVISQALIDAATITNSNLNGGTSFEQTITFDSGGGMLFGYSSTTTTVTQTANGTYTQTLPAGVTTINNAYCWGAGAGGDGGNTSEGGTGGGAGEFAGESTYTPSQNPFSYVVGRGGNSSTTGNGHGGNGGDSFIDNGGVFANGGNGDGTPGTGSTNSIHHDGGTGGGQSGNAGGASGGNSGNPTAKGNNGLASIGSGHAGAPAAQTGSGTGGAGGDSGGNASNGGSPGAGGGGAGQGSNSTGSKTVTYEALYTGSYYGPDASSGAPPNGLRSTSVMYQGGETSGGGTFNGNMRSIMGFNRAQIASDFAGYTITSCKLKLTNQHTWFNSGMTFQVDEYAGLPGSVPGSFPASAYQDTVAQGTIAEGDTHTYELGAALGQRFATGATNGLGLGFQVPSTQPYNLNYYGYFTGGHGTALELTITGTQTVAGSTTSGQGADGKVSFQFTTAQTMVFALSPVAGSDANGNAFGQGYTGPVNVFDPNASPAAPEQWHSMTLANGWTKQGFARYKLIGYNTMLIELQINDSSATSGTFAVMPTGYAATVSQFPEITEFANVAGTPSNPWVVQVNTGPGGALTILNWAKQSKQFVGNIVISLD